MMTVGVGVIVAMHPRFVLMLLPVMAVGTTLVAMFMLVLVFVVATHLSFTSLIISFN
jgi:hypothetical protein